MNKTHRFPGASIVMVILFVTGSTGSSWAKPLPAPTEEEAYRSEFIVIAEYLGYRAQGEIGYFRPPLARYRVIRVLKGTGLPGILRVHHAFQDGSADLAPAGWRFSEGMMPEQGSRWILFLERSEGPGIFTTYRGDFGRREATEGNVERVEAALRR